MESVHNKASKFASEDIISRMPKDIISNILDRLPIQDAVKTGILSRNWMYSWTTRSQLVFDQDFFEYLLRKNAQHLFNKENLGSLLLRLKGPVTKFVLYIPPDIEFAHIARVDIGHWILFLSTKGLKELVLINKKFGAPLDLPTHLFSCPELKHLKLRDCSLRPTPGYHGFPNLASSDSESCYCEEEQLVASYPFHQTLKTCHQNLKPAAELEKLKVQSMLMCKLVDMRRAGSNIFQLMGFLPKLEELHLECQMLTLLGKRPVRVTFPCLKSLTLDGLNFNSNKMVSCAYAFINGSPRLETLKIKAGNETLCGYSEVDYGIRITCKLQLQNVELEGIEGSEIEVYFIKSLLANSFVLKKMVIIYGKPCRWYRSKLLKLHRASSIAEIYIT